MLYLIVEKLLLTYSDKEFYVQEKVYAYGNQYKIHHTIK